jgi:hypothetical protein
VRKTDARLHEALISLIHDKSYGSIAVRDILDRADVGRSTFYAHFRDKDDLPDERHLRGPAVDSIDGSGIGSVRVAPAGSKGRRRRSNAAARFTRACNTRSRN